MADSDSNPAALGTFLYVPRANQFQLIGDSDYDPASFRPYSPGVFGQALLDSQGFLNADSPFMSLDTIVDAYNQQDSTYGGFIHSPYRGNRSEGQGLIMALDSDAQNATGGGEAGGGLTQYWIG